MIKVNQLMTVCVTRKAIVTIRLWALKSSAPAPTKMPVMPKMHSKRAPKNLSSGGGALDNRLAGVKSSAGRDSTNRTVPSVKTRADQSNSIAAASCRLRRCLTSAADRPTRAAMPVGALAPVASTSEPVEWVSMTKGWVEGGTGAHGGHTRRQVGEKTAQLCRKAPSPDVHRECRRVQEGSGDGNWRSHSPRTDGVICAA